VSRTAAMALDTSVAVPLLVQTHPAHADVMAWAQGRRLALSGHAAAETYSILTRLPAELRQSPDRAAELIRFNFANVLPLSPSTAERIHEVLARLNIAGGAVYDALVALAAQENEATLATRDRRARPTYDAVGVTVEMV